MSSQYPILDNRPIDQWKVTELKEELKRRKLMTKGLKDDLIRRLDEAIRIEWQNAEREKAEKEKAEEQNTERDVNNGCDLESEPALELKNAQEVIITDATTDVLGDDVSESKTDDVKVMVDINDSVEAAVQGNLKEGVIMGGLNSYRGQGERDVDASSVDTSTAVTESLESAVALGAQDYGTQEGTKISSIQLENEDLKPQLESEGLKSPQEDVKLDCAAPTNQVFEVNPNLGFQVKSDSISSDSMSINEKIELKDNIIADDVKLELDVVKPEMVEPSSGNVVPVCGESHPMDVEEPIENPSVEEKDESNATNEDMGKKNDSLDAEYSEKLNLDRSSGDDSVEEDALESKQIDSKYYPDEVGDKSGKSEALAVEENLVDVVETDLSIDQNENRVDNRILPALPAEKRKLNDQEAVENTEPLKRQRRWNSESLKVPEPQSSNLTAAPTPKDSLQPTPLKRNFSRSDSSISEDALKERVVLPSQKTPTNSLRIDRFLRPFTLKAVQELLGKTGTVTSFWMDQIKTHCYVTYSSVEEAIETRNAVYNLQWPPNGGRLLVADYVEAQEVKMRLEAPPQFPAAPVTPSATAPSTLQPQPSPRQQVSRQQLPPPPPLPSPPPLSNPPLARERLAHPPPPQPLPSLPQKHDPPIVTLDDLFRKTKATPRIYYLPLSEKQVAPKLAERGKNTKQ